jgi:S-adenosylmethionine hydrolase
MIVLFTDFGLEGPYTGQVKAVLWREAPGACVIDLFADAPAARPRESAYLLAAYAAGFPPGTIFLAVVDPGVGGARPPVAISTDGRWFVGPGNGLFEQVIRRSPAPTAYRIEMSGPPASASFHGRDVFAPVAGRLAAGRAPAEAGLAIAAAPRFDGWPDDLAAIVYVDRFGNLLTGLRASGVTARRLRFKGKTLARARTFGDVPEGHGFWYENANGLAEIAVNGGRADRQFGAGIGDLVEIVDD